MDTTNANNALAQALDGFAKAAAGLANLAAAINSGGNYDRASEPAAAPAAEPKKRAAKATAAAEPAAAPAAAAPAETTDAEFATGGVDAKTLRARFSDFAAKHGDDKALSVLSKFGVERLGNLKTDAERQDVYNEVISIETGKPAPKAAPAAKSSMYE